MNQGKKVIVIGGTGATGKQLIKHLLISDEWGQITSIGRRSVLDGKNDKLQDIVIESLYDLSSTEKLWKGHDVFFNCIGTTRKRAGSAKKFIEIEVGFSMEAARLASKAKIPHACLVSATGANHKQWAKNWIHPLLYIRTMGQKEQTIIKNKFSRVSIFRPGMLIRLVENQTFIESVMERYGFGLRVDDLALAMIHNAEKINDLQSADLSLAYLNNKNIKIILQECKKVSKVKN